MARKLILYLDTSVLNFLFADDAPEKRDITIDFFQEVSKKKYEVYISDIVIDEISKATEDKKEKLLTLIDNYKLNFVDINDEVKILAKRILEQKIIPVHKTGDAMHIAIAVCNGADILLSWNFKHLANVNKERKIRALCLLEGYDGTLEMRTPMEVIDDD